MGFQNIIDAEGINGISLAITGMGIVFTVLVLVSIYITCLPRVLPLLGEILPVIEHHHGAPMPSPALAQAHGAVAPEVVAAIGIVLHHSKK